MSAFAPSHPNHPDLGRSAGGRPILMAHRGAPLLQPENTIASFRAALQAGADVVEMDVRTSRDGILVIVHDATLDRVSGQCGKVAELTAAQLQSVQLRGPGLSDPEAGRIPRLEEVFHAFPNAVMNVDLKAVPKARVADVFKLINDVRSLRGMAPRVLLTSSCADIQKVIQTHNMASDVQLGMGRDDVLQALRAAWLRRPPIERLRGRACQMPAHATVCGVNVPLLKGPFIPYLRAMKCPLHVWWDQSRMVDDVKGLEACRRWGVDGIFTHDIAALAGASGRRVIRQKLP